MEATLLGGFASALLDVVSYKLTAFLKDDLHKIKDSDRVLGRLQTTLADADKVLRQVDISEFQGIDRRMDDLTNLFYDSEDLIQDIALEMARCSASCEKPLLRTILSGKTSLFTPRAVAKLQSKLDTVVEELKYLLTTTNQTASNISPSNGGAKPDLRMITPLRTDETEAIVQQLIATDSKSHGVSVLGGHGLGKTWLSAAIQHEPRVAIHFSSIFWVGLGGGFEGPQIIEQLDRQAKEYSSSSEACSKSQQAILIILDNLLEVTSLAWPSLLSRIKRAGINGSSSAAIKFLITTSNPNVAEISHTSSHHLKPLSDEDCRKLINDTAELYTPALSHSNCQTAVSLTQRCGGLPSVAIILGEYFARQHNHKPDDLSIDNFWDSDIFRDEISPILTQFYSRVQPHFKRCLAYFSLFPHSHVFTVDDLIQLRVGEGFIQEPGGTSSSLKTARKCFTHLVGMSILRRSDQITHSGFPAFELNPFGLKLAQLIAS